MGSRKIQPPHFLIVAPYLPSLHHPSIPLFLEEESRALSRYGKVTLFLPVLSEKEDLPSLPEIPNRTPLFLPFPSPPLSLSGMVEFFARAIPLLSSLTPVHLIVAHSPFPSGLWGIWLKPFLMNPPLFLVVHDSILQTPPRSLLKRSLLKGIVRRVDRVLYVSPVLEREGRRQWGDHPSSVVLPGVPGYKDLPSRGNPPQDRFTLLFVGRLIPSKGILELLSAVETLFPRFSDLRLVIVGDGPLREKVFQYKDRWKDRIVYRGYLPHREVIQEMIASHLLVLPSSPESLGLVYLETMSLGVPIVACEGEGISFWIRHGKNGFLVPPHHPSSLTDTLTSILMMKRERIERIGMEGKKTVLREGFSWEIRAKRIVSLWEDLYASQGIQGNL